MSSRIHFQETLAEIRQDVLRMGTEAHDLVRLAIEATLAGDPNLAAQVIAADDTVDAAERETLQRAVVVVMQQAPVATDLRLLLSTFEIVGEIEKVGDHAVKLARRGRKLEGRFPEEMRGALKALGDQALGQFAASLQLYANYSSELAAEVIRGDETVDDGYTAACAAVYRLIEVQPQRAEDLVRTIDCFHALEHVADHATSIAKRMAMLNERSGRLPA
ncbi:MAG: phosphate signaling complex protein PhoU [Fimbriimonas sp.]